MDEAVTHYCHNDACSMKGVEQLRWWSHRNPMTGGYGVYWTSDGRCKECGKRMYPEGKEPPAPPALLPVDPERSDAQRRWAEAERIVRARDEMHGTRMSHGEYQRECMRVATRLELEARQ